jgi:hypothetical protein
MNPLSEVSQSGGDTLLQSQQQQQPIEFEELKEEDEAMIDKRLEAMLGGEKSLINISSNPSAEAAQLEESFD